MHWTYCSSHIELTDSWKVKCLLEGFIIHVWMKIVNMCLQEDDELARALALSLGGDGQSKEDPTAANKGKEVVVEEETSQAPPVEDMLSTCMNLLQNTDAVAFPLTDLLVTMCNRNKGQDRPRVISYLVQQLKLCKVEVIASDMGPLSTISHTLALVLSEDSTAREIAAENGMVTIALDILEQFRPAKTNVKEEVPKWVTALLLVLDHMLQYKPKINSDLPGGLATGAGSGAGAGTGTGAGAGAAASNSLAAVSGLPTSDGQKPEVDKVLKEKGGNPFVAILGRPTGYMTDDEQQRAMLVAGGFLQMQLPSTTVQAVLQLCARLTKSHPTAMKFLETGDYCFHQLEIPYLFLFILLLYTVLGATCLSFTDNLSLGFVCNSVSGFVYAFSEGLQICSELF